MKKRVTRLEPAPPYAALELYEDQVRAGHRGPYRPGELVSDSYAAAARWERSAVNGPITEAAKLARVGRAFLTGKSPRTRRGRWRRDLDYLEVVEREAQLTLPPADHQKYADMVADWRVREPRGILARYIAARNRQRRQVAEDGKGR